MTNVYNTNGILDTVTTNNGVVFKFNYDENDTKQKIKSVNIGSNTLISYLYENENVKSSNIYPENIKSVTYGVSGDSYSFTYYEDDRIKEIYLNDTLCFKYNYDSFGRLISVEDHLYVNTKIYSLTYDDENKLIEISDTMNTIHYSYDLNGINNISYNVYGKERIHSFSPLLVNSPESFYHEIIKGFTSTNNYNYVASFYGNANLATNTYLNLPEITPLYKDFSKLSIDGYLSVMNWPDNNGERLAYKYKTWGKYPLPCQTITGWFKPGSLSNNGFKYLFSVGNDDVKKNFIGLIIDPLGRLILRLTDMNGTVYTPLITTSTIKVNKWNFFSLTWYNRNDGEGYVDECSYEVMLNDEYKKIVKSNPRYLISLDYPEELFNFGCTRTSNNLPTNQFKGEMTGLILSNYTNLQPREVRQLYNLGKESLFKDINYYKTSGFNQYNEDLIRNYEFIPLNNSLIESRQTKPYDVELRKKIINSDINRSFKFDTDINRTT